MIESDDDGPAPPALITQSDPPEHTYLRDLLRPGFARASIIGASPWIREYVHHLIDKLPAGGPADVVGDIALPLTAHVIARLVGVPREDAAELARLSLAITVILPASFTGTDDWRQIERYFTEAARQRRAAADQPDHLITRLALGTVDGRRLTDQDVAFHAWQLFVAGLESTAYTIGSTVYQLLASRHRWEELLSDRSLLNGVRRTWTKRNSVRMLPSSMADDPRRADMCPSVSASTCASAPSCPVRRSRRPSRRCLTGCRGCALRPVRVTRTSPARCSAARARSTSSGDIDRTHRWSRRSGERSAQPVGTVSGEDPAAEAPWRHHHDSGPADRGAGPPGNYGLG